jgi:uncharacterized protein (DUF2267 family)
MSLERYCRHKRTVIQNSSTSAYDAVRALENNHIGAIVVQDLGRVVGIVTDRDLALRVAGFDLPPKETPLCDVMTPEPATLSIYDSEEQAADLMRLRHVRRIPIVDGERVMGIVTLDDLIVSGAVDFRTVADVVDAQLTEPARAKPPGVTYPTRPAAGGPRAPVDREARHAARADQTLRDFLARLRRDLALDEAERARTAFEVVASGLVRRLTPEEARDFVAQLPSSIRDKLLELPPGPDPEITRDTMQAEMAQKLDLDADHAMELVRKVAACLSDFVSAGEVEHVVSQLPREMKEIFVSP